MTWCIGINENKRFQLQLNLRCFMDANSASNRPLLAQSHCVDVGHLHQMQAWSQFAASIPQTIARNLRSPPRYVSISYLLSLIVILLISFPSLQISSNEAAKFSYVCLSHFEDSH